MPTVTESWCCSPRDQEEGRGLWGRAWEARLPGPFPWAAESPLGDGVPGGKKG